METSERTSYCSPDVWDLAKELNVVSVYGVKLIPAVVVGD
jgi:hypothetical protein